MLSELKTGTIDRWVVISENSETQVEKVSNQPDGLQRGESAWKQEKARSDCGDLLGIAATKTAWFTTWFGLEGKRGTIVLFFAHMFQHHLIRLIDTPGFETLIEMRGQTIMFYIFLSGCRLKDEEHSWAYVQQRGRQRKDWKQF